MITNEQTDVIRELIQGHDYTMQLQEERAIFNSRMTADGWNPIWDTFDILYRWRHVETGRMIDDTLAFNSWLPTYRLPESEKPALG